MMEGYRLSRDKVFWLTLLMSAFFLSITLWFRFSTEHALYRYGAWVWKTYHLPPYIGVWDRNFPGIFIVHRIALEIFGESMLGFRAFDFLVQSGSVAMIYYLARRLTGSRAAAFVAGVFYSVYYAGLGSMETGEAEGFILFMLLASTVLGFQLARRVWLRAVLVGTILGLVFLLQPRYGLGWLLFGIWFFMEAYQKPDSGPGPGRRGAWGELAVFTAFSLIPSGLWVFWYWRLGYGEEFYRAVILFNQEVLNSPASAQFAGLGGWGHLLYTINRDYLRESLVLLSGLLMIVSEAIGGRIGRDRKLFRILVGWAGISLICYLLQGKYYFYQLTPLMGFMMIFAGSFLAWAVRPLQGGAPMVIGRILCWCYYAIIFATMIIAINNRIPDSLAYEYGRPLRTVYSRGQSQDARYYRMAGRLAAMIGSEEEIGYFGWHPLLPDLLKKRLPSRFCCVDQLLLRTSDGVPSPLQREWIKEYTEAALRNRPRFFLVATYVPGWKDLNLKGPGLNQAMHELFPELEIFLQKHYKLTVKDSLVEVYERVGE